MTHAMTPSRTSSTTPPATSGIGWLHGIASQVSFPSISVLRFVAALRARSRLRRDLLGHDSIEQRWIDLAIGKGLGRALLGQVSIASAIQCRASPPNSCKPISEFILRDGVHLEPHVRETVTAELRRQAVVITGMVGL